MSTCPRCLALTDDTLVYCGVCNRPRIVESLRIPVAPPEWLPPLQKMAFWLLIGWFVITTGVAFMREAKALRDSREYLAQSHPDKAWQVLEPFLKDHPQDKQGLFLSGEATIRLRKIPEAKQYLATLTEVSPELATNLSNDYRAVITARASSLDCASDGFPQLLAETQQLGGSYQSIVMTGLQSLVESCTKQENAYVPRAVSTLLANQGNPTDIVTKGYVPAIKRALDQARFSDAKALAMQSNQIVPAGRRNVSTLLEPERAKVTATMLTIRNLCESLRSPQYFANGGWCFPADPPLAVRTAKDAWGRSIVYSTSNPSPNQSCRYAVALSSYGFSGQAPNSPQQIPEGGATCHIQWGGEYWQLPDRFWLKKEPTSYGGVQATDYGY